MTKPLIFLAALAVSAVLTRPLAAAEAHLTVPGEILSLSPLTTAEGRRLAVFHADDARPRRKRSLSYVVKMAPARGGKAGSYTVVDTRAVPDDASAFDRCQLDPAKPVETLLYVRSDGVYAEGDKTPLAKVTTVFPHARDDALTRLKICFPGLYKGEGAALVVPVLEGVSIFRQEKPGRFQKDADLATEPLIRTQGVYQRGEDIVQRVILRMEYPDVQAVDFDGDGKLDVCAGLEDQLVCHIAGSTGFKNARTVRETFQIASDDEKKQASLRVDHRLLDVTGDGKVDVLAAKSSFDLSDMRTEISVFAQGSSGFSRTPSQKIARKGYFSFHEYVDLDADGKLDLVAPTASLSYTELIGIFVSKSADVEFVWYKNLGGGKFDPNARSFQKVRFPVEPKNWSTILGVLPAWDVKLKGIGKQQKAVAFFPNRKGVQLYTIDAKGETSRLPVWEHELEKGVLGSELVVTDLDSDESDELIFAYPRDAKQARELLVIEASVR